LDSTGRPNNCDTTKTCYNPILDSKSFNPYVYGLLGNFRANKSYVYYGARKEENPLQATDIRRDGTFKDFKPFWSFGNKGISPNYDTVKWVWNSELTMFNGKGLEIENKDPLGRFNSGLYGYGKTLPVAVIQNSRYQENAFEGFEDYDFVSGICDTACQPARHWDFSFFKYYIDATQHHTGKYSIRVNANKEIGLGANVKLPDDTDPKMRFVIGAEDTCIHVFTLDSIVVTPNIILPNFQPLPGKKMVFSAWVKEGDVCSSLNYANNAVNIVVKNSSGGTDTAIVAKPSGNIIEGWQRYEQVFPLSATAASLSVVLKSTGTSAVYFDDLRIHPFNAN
ncbi:MAG: hypothetical protein HY305_00665, partial [Sphingobacteriales bacterium]|nr:hypothetical protein [Sphingobacteriales bacterium]